MQTRVERIKLLACAQHAWPVLGCEDCWRRLMDKVEDMMGQAAETERQERYREGPPPT